MPYYKHEYSKSIYEMELHEELIEKEYNVNATPMHILRVHGGWIYYHPFIGGREGTFVPYTPEGEVQ